MKLTKGKQQSNWKVGYTLLLDRRPLIPARIPISESEQDISAMVGFLVLVGVFWLGINVGLFFANLLK